MSESKYIKCPRCELNYIEKSQKLCKVCQEELKANQTQAGRRVEDLENDMLCPVCRSNYISDDEEMCSMCAREKELAEENEASNSESDNWRMYVEDDDKSQEDVQEAPTDDLDEDDDMLVTDDLDDLDDEEEPEEDDSEEESDDLDDLDDLGDLDDLDDDDLDDDDDDGDDE